MEKVRVGFVGVGRNGMAHMEAHTRLGKSVVYAACDRNEKRLQTVRERFGVQKCYSDDAIYDDPDVDAITINTGDPFHVEPFVKALAAGKHVLVEKPVGNSPEQLLEMAAAARKAAPGLKVQCGFVLRYNPVYEAVHRLCREGKLGRIFYMESDYIHNLIHQKFQTDEVTGKNWYLEEEHPLTGGGCHQLDLLRWFSGREVVEVTGYGNHAAFPEMRHNDCEIVLFKFDDGAVAKVACAYGPATARPPFTNLRVYGTSGTVERDAVAIATGPEDYHPALKPIEAERIKGHPYDPEIGDWLDAIRDNRPTRCGFYDGANSTMACLKGIEAIRSGQPVVVPVLRPQP